MISYTEDTINNLVTLSRHNFEYAENNEELKNFYKKAFAEDRFIYLYKNVDCIGFLVFYLFNEDDIKFMLEKKSGFNFPEHKKNGKYLYIEECVIFKQFRNCPNLLYLREVFANAFLQIRGVCWHKSLIGEEKRIFNLHYSAERKYEKSYQYN